MLVGLISDTRWPIKRRDNVLTDFEFGTSGHP